MSSKVRWQHYLTGYGLLGLLRLSSWLPFEFSLKLGRALGWLIYYLVSSRRRICQTNVALCFPELNAAQQQALVKNSFKVQGQALIETAHAWYKPVDYWLTRVDTKGFELLAQAMQQQQGILLTCAHFGSLDLYGAIMANFCQFDLVQRDLNNPIVNARMQQARRRYGQPIQRRDSKAMIRALRAKRILFYAPDQDFGRKNSVFVDFFNIPTATLTATTRLASLGRAKVLFGFPHQTSWCYRMQVEDPQQIPSDNPEADALLYNEWLEAKIRQVPEQYLWQHRRFKTRPSQDEPRLY